MSEKKLNIPMQIFNYKAKRFRLLREKKVKVVDNMYKLR